MNKNQLYSNLLRGRNCQTMRRMRASNIEIVCDNINAPVLKKSATLVSFLHVSGEQLLFLSTHSSFKKLCS